MESAELEEAGIFTFFTDLFEGWAQLKEGAMLCGGLDEAVTEQKKAESELQAAF